MTEPVKKCSTCGREYSTADLVDNPDFRVLGMMSERHGFDAPVYFFNHDCPDCHTTFTQPAAAFAGFITEPVPEQNLAGTAACGGHCKKLDDLTECKATCANAPYRRFLVNVLLKSPRTRAAAVGAAPQRP